MPATGNDLLPLEDATSYHIPTLFNVLQLAIFQVISPQEPATSDYLYSSYMPIPSYFYLTNLTLLGGPQYPPFSPYFASSSVHVFS